MKKIILISLIILGLVAAGGIYLYSQRNQPGHITIPFIATKDSKSENDNSEETEPKELFRNYGPAPEFTGITKWLNGDAVKMSDLRGKTVLVFFWTYSDINSFKAIPSIAKWNDTYKDQGLVVIGVHTPEFTFEKVTGNVENSLKANHANFLVAQDNDYKTWTAYKNQFWPARYLIDKDGNIVYTHFGDGDYDVTEKAIRTLIGLEGEYQAPQPTQTSQANSPEMFFGLAKQGNFGNVEKPSGDEQIYSFPPKLGNNKFAIEGSWQFNQEAAIHTKGFGRIKLNFDAAKVYMVAQSNTPTTIRVYVDGTLIKGVVVSNSDLYQLYDSIAGGKHTMEIEVPDGGFQAFTFTFE